MVDALLNVSQGRNQSISRAELLSGGSGENLLGAHSGCWQDSVPYSCRNESQFSCWLSARGCSVLLNDTLRSLPSGPLHQQNQRNPTLLWIFDFPLLPSRCRFWRIHMIKSGPSPCHKLNGSGILITSIKSLLPYKITITKVISIVFIGSTLSQGEMITQGQVLGWFRILSATNTMKYLC